MPQHGLQRNTLSNCEYTANRYEYEPFQLNIWQFVFGCFAEINMTLSCIFIWKWKAYSLSEKKGGREEQWNEGRKKGRKIGRKEGRKEGRKGKEKRRCRTSEERKMETKEKKKGKREIVMMELTLFSWPWLLLQSKWWQNSVAALNVLGKLYVN